METLNIIIDILHRGYEHVIGFLEQCKRVLEEFGPLLGEVVILGLPFTFSLWFVYEVAEFFIPNFGVIVAILFAVPIIIFFTVEIFRRKREKALADSETVTGSVWSLKKIIFVVVLDAILIGAGLAMHKFNSSREKIARIQRQSKDLGFSENKNLSDATQRAEQNVSPTNTSENKNITAAEPLEIPQSPSGLYMIINSSASKGFRWREVDRYLREKVEVDWELELYQNPGLNQEDKDTVSLNFIDTQSFKIIDEYGKEITVKPSVSCTVSLSKYEWLKKPNITEGTILRVQGIITKITGIDETNKYYYSIALHGKNNEPHVQIMLK